MSHVFISYSTKNKDYAYELADKLRAEGFDVWIDNDKLKVSQHWWTAIVQAIWDCGAFVVILTPESHESRWVNREILLADQWRKPKFPILLDGEISRQFPLWLMFIETQYEDVRGANLPSVDFYEQLARDVNRQDRPGKNVTAAPPAVPKNVKLKKEINNPPPKTEFTARGETVQRNKPTRRIFGLSQDLLKRILVVAGGLLVLSVLAVILVFLVNSAFILFQRVRDIDVTRAALAPTPTYTPSLSPTPTETSTLTSTDASTLIPTLTPTRAFSDTLTPTTLTLTTSPSGLTGDGCTYIVQLGDTLSTIAFSHNVTLDELHQANLEVVSNLVQVGQVINIPGCMTMASTPASSDISTLTPTVSLIESTTTPVASNGDWTPIERDFAGVTMVLVPAGCFTMGSTEPQIDYALTLSSDFERGYFAIELPTTRVCFNHPFWLDKYEVTHEQFGRLGGTAAIQNYWTDSNQPRANVTWFEAGDFCDVRGARLPTEAEWEYAARGPDNLNFPWGNTLVPDNAVYYNNSGNQTASVGSRLGGVSWVGALDLSGNVWEWLSTLYQAYPYPVDVSGFVVDDGREDTSNGTDYRVIRGGSWVYVDDYLRAAARASISPTFEGNYVGFRCARDDE